MGERSTRNRLLLYLFFVIVYRDKTNHKLLLNLSATYSLYDKEIGYCQGFSFIMAVLLLHIPEEQSFAVLVKIMCEYELRGFQARSAGEKCKQQQINKRTIICFRFVILPVCMY